VATPGNASVKLTWKQPASNGGAAIDKYAVQRYNPAKSAWENIAFPTGLSYTKSPLTNGTKYSFRILAHNSAGWSAPSIGVSAIPGTMPSAPTSPVATPGNASVKLTWKQPASNGATVDKYEVQRYMPGGSWTTIATPTTLSYPAGGLLNGITYSFRIRAHNAAGWGPYSTVVNAVPRTVPDAPFALQATPSDNYVGLKWSAPPNGGAPIDNYRVQLATSLAGPWTTYVGVNGSVPVGGFGYPEVTNGTTYYFKVAAHNAVGWGQYSWAVNAVPRTVPSAPGLSAQLATPAWAKLNWTRPAQNGGAPIESYRFEQATDLGGPWTLAATTAVSADMVSGHAYVGGLKPGTTYYFRAAAVNAAGQGPYNIVTVSVTTPATVPGAPTPCTAYQTSSSTMYIDWSAPTSDGGSPIINYNVLIEKGQWKWQFVSSDWDHVEGYWYWDKISIVGHDTVASITARTAVVSPGAYKIFIRARNSVGYGPLCETYVEII
jgi:Fibronectin type III domain